MSGSVNMQVDEKLVQEGVSFRVLLDSRLLVKIPSICVGIDNTVIKQMMNGSGNNLNLPPVLSQNGVYGVAGVRHIGDTRGNDWYTDVVGVTSKSGILDATAESLSLH